MAVDTDQLLDDIANYCRRVDIAESTFGRRAVNDGKLTQRLRQGGKITTDTLDRIQALLGDVPESAPKKAALARRAKARAVRAARDKQRVPGKKKSNRDGAGKTLGKISGFLTTARNTFFSSIPVQRRRSLQIACRSS